MSGAMMSTVAPVSSASAAMTLDIRA